MTLKSLLAAGILSLGALAAQAEVPTAHYRIVPLPASITATHGGDYRLTPSAQVLYPAGNAEMESNARMLAQYIADNLGFTPAIAPYTPNKKGAIDPKEAKGNIVLAIDPKVENAEGYTLNILPTAVTIAASTPAGAFYGVQTLRKTLPVAPRGTVTSEVSMPSAQIADAPRFPYRGMLLDTGRHYIAMDGIKQFLDLMALHNMNTFHWHITDDQGWRIELKRHPELTEKGSMRRQTICGRVAGVYDGTPHGGYYSQNDIREILAYAKERHIKVIPEIDMPGHTLSLLASHPEVGCTGGPYGVAEHWGVYPEILCAGKDATFKLMEEILDEVAELFPGEYIHIGGDEAPKDRWRTCPDCQARIAAEGIKATPTATAENQLQGYFTKRIEQYLNSKGRKVIGWDEILEGEIDPSATVMCWRDTESIARGANAGHDVIAASSPYNYLDYYQREDKNAEPFLIGGYLPLSKCYRFEPFSPELLPENRSHVIGVQACVWGEFIGEKNLMTYQMLPRMAAVSESQWIAPDRKLYHDFLERMRTLTPVYDRYDYPWCRGWE